MPIGQPIREEVTAQIKARQNLMAKKDRSKGDVFNYMTQRNAWIKVSSSVNTGGVGQVTTGQTNTGDASLAKNAVLYNFGIAKNGTEGSAHLNASNEGGGTSTNRSINNGPIPGGFKDVANNGAYTEDSVFGVRPTTGITGFTAKSKGTYGTLRECKVEFNVYTLTDLELMNDLYFRPGFTCLVEWGHTSYIDSQGVANSEIFVVQDYFQSGKDQYDIQNEITKLQKKTDYNYDAICGFVKNFNWTFQAPGYYACSIDVIARGEVIESLMSDFDPIDHFGKEHFSDKDEEKGKSQRRSPFHFICETLNDIDDGDFLTKSDIVDEVDTLAPYILDDAKFPRHSQDLADTGWIFEDSVNMVYITIRDVLHIFNEAIFPKDKSKDDAKLIGFNTRYNAQRASDPEVDAKSIVNTNFFKLDNHFSIDPYICFLYDMVPTKPLKNEVRLVIGGLFSAGGGGITGGNDIQKTVKERVTKAHKEGAEGSIPSRLQDGANSILDISVSTHYILEILDSMYDQDGNTDKGVVDFFRPFLDGISDALGGINELDLYFNEDDQLFYVIDRKLDFPTKCPELNITGLDNIVQDLTISSKISNEMSSMISIAASPTVTDNSEKDFHAMFKWNKGKTDRIVSFKDNRKSKSGGTSNEEDKSTREIEQYESWIEDLDDAFGRYCNRSFRNQKYAKGDHDALRSYHKEWSSRQVKDDSDSKGKPVPGVIPVELSLKLDGIAGLRVAEAFKINGEGILLQDYKDFGYIITSLSHTIENNRWVTDVGTQFYSIKEPTPNEQAVAQQRKNAANKGYATSQGSTPAAFETANFDPKQALNGDNVDYDMLEKAIKEEGYPWTTQKHVLNIIGIRNMRGAEFTSYGVKLPGTNHFDDLICVAYIDENGKKQAQAFPASTDPGFSALAKPSNTKGTAILKEGHYKDTWTIGAHGGSARTRHIAFRQTSGEVTVFRDKTKDTTYDLDRRREFTGYFGINIHKGSVGTGVGTRVGNWSEGCQIFKNGAQQIKVMTLAKKQKELAGKSTFSYSLIRSTNKVIKEAKLI